MGRTVVAYSLPATIVALAWLRLEEPRAGGGDGLWIVLLALVPALLPTLAARLVAVPWVALVATWIAFGSPDPAGGPRRGFFAPAYDSFVDGIAGYYDTRVPFSGIESPAMHGVLVLAIFGFCVLLGLVVASRRPLPAVLLLLAGAGWPATLLPTEGLVVGTLILAAALWVLAALRLTRPTPALAAGLVVVAAAIALSSSSAIAKDGVVAWERWDPYRSGGNPVGVDYVWDANYGGIDFPDKPTTVLRIRAPRRSLYWRATTLDQFTADRWIESLAPIGLGRADGPLARDPLLPAAAYEAASWTKQEVEIVGARRRPPRRRDRADRLRGRGAGARPTPRRGDRAASGLAPARPALHGLQLHAAAEAGRAGALPCELSGEPRALSRPRPHPGAGVRNPRPRA